MNLYLRGLKKPIVLVIMIVLINSFVLGALAGTLEEYQNNPPAEDKIISVALETDDLELLNIDPNLFTQYYPMGGSRSDTILGTLIGPGDYTGSVGPLEFDFYTIPLNGSSGNTDEIYITVETNTAALGYASMASPDLFVIGGDFVSSSATTYINRTAITTANHYIVVANPLSGTLDYYLNISTIQTTNGQNDANNDFANATAAVDGSSFQEGLNYTLDYWDEFNITIPTERNLTVTCEIISSHYFDVTLALYDAQNSSDEHLLAEVDKGWADEDEVLYYESNITQIDGYLHVTLWNVMGTSAYGTYWLNFSINEINSGPRINLSDPILNTWNSLSGLSINEDEVSDGEIMLSQHFIDDGKPTTPGVLEYTYESSDDVNLSVVIHPNSSVTITPVANWYGNAVVTFYANDSVVKKSDDLNITVNSVNDKPILDPADDWVVSTVDNMTIMDSENLRFTQGLYASFNVTSEDIDSASLSYSATLNITNTSLAVDAVPFVIASTTGNIEFIPTNDWIGTILVNITVSDGTDIDYHIFTFWFDNTNDDTKLEMVNTAAVVGNTAVITGTDGATQDEQFVLTVTAMDMDMDIGIMETLVFGASSKEVTLSDDGAYGDLMYNFSFTPDNDDAMRGYVHVNLTVKDHAGSGWDDWAIVNISVANVNDAPTVEFVDNKKPVDHESDQGQINADEMVNVTIIGADIDGQTLICAATGNTTVTVLAGINKWNVTFKPNDGDEGNTIVNVSVSDGTETDYVHLKWLVIAIKTPPTVTITSEDNKKAKTSDQIIIEGTYSDEDSNIIDEIQTKLEFPDGTKTDFYNIGYSEEDYNDLSESHRTGQLISGVYVWEYLTVNTDGTWEYMFDTKTYNAAYDWYSVNANDMMDLFGLVAKVTKGDMIFTFKAIDDDDLESVEQSLTTIFEDAEGVITDTDKDGMDDDWEELHFDDITKCDPNDDPDKDGKTNLEEFLADTDPLVKESVESPDDKKDEDDEGEKTLSVGLFDYDILLFVVVIIIVIVLVLMVFMKKKKPTEEELPSPEGAPVAPTEVTCTACGTMIPGGAEACPNCGVAAPMPPPPPPPEAPPTAPVDVYCQSCGAILPTDAAACPSCGAAAPIPPPEAPPSQEGIPPEQAYMEQPPPPPQEGIPPGQEQQMYMEAAPPQEGMAPEQTYMEQPPPPQEGIPPEQSYMEQPPPPPPQQQQPDYGAPQEQQYIPPQQPPGYGAPQEQQYMAPPPAGIANCPQCGNQIPFGATPCPACGTPLNW